MPTPARVRPEPVPLGLAREHVAGYGPAPRPNGRQGGRSKRGALIFAAIAFGAGALQAAAFAPFDAWWLQLAALAVLPLLIMHAPARAALSGFAFGLGWFLAGVSWLYISMHRYGGMPAPLAGLALLAFAAYLALFPMLVSLLAAWPLRRRGALAVHALDIGAARQGTAQPGTAQPESTARESAPGISTALLFAGGWGITEMVRGHLFTGFPWLAIGYAHVDGPLAGFAPWVGVYGISALAALAAAGLALVLRAAATRRAASWSGLACALLPLAAGVALAGIDWVEPAGKPLAVRLLQGNVPQEMKFDRERSLRSMQHYTEQVLQAPAQLTVLPETAWTTPWSATPAPLAEALADHAARHGGVIAIGMPLVVAPSADAPQALRLTNSVAVIDGRGLIATRYDKRHLVPFGEFIPLGFGWFVRMMNIPLGEFARGGARQPPLTLAGARIAFNICYEDLFGEELAQQVRDGATILVNVSNIAWFGDSHALPQHLQIARMRAIEFARPMLRSTNTGVTAAIDARGRVIGQLPAYTVGALAVSVEGADGMTPFSRAAVLLPAALALTLLAAGLLADRRAQRRARMHRAGDLH
ncbi:MAG: apolipoprotein N-acyltransferase [Burkholderiales bacterium]|nr:apolipoprotein N-acyltransferase [Burkholderiales bacterium]ODU68822.1 MAG: apolipoprotein N-acyltransferase [Lautropia sp. SCN 66-9]